MIYIMATSASTIATWFRQMLFSINETIYKFIATVYDFILRLADQSNLIIENTDIGTYSSKIYVFIGIVMLFRMGIVLLKYIADPEKVMDKKDGIGPNVVPRVITVLVLLVLTPTIFGWLYQLQSLIFSSAFFTDFFGEATTVADNTADVSGDSKSGTVSSIHKEKDTVDNQCTYYLNPKTNNLCISYPGLYQDASAVKEGNIVAIGTKPDYDSPYTFCPSKIVVNQNNKTVNLYSSSGSKVSITKDDVSEYWFFNTENEKAFNKIVDSSSGCQKAMKVLLPAELTGYTAKGYNMASKEPGIPVERSVDHTSNDIISFGTTSSGSNYYLSGYYNSSVSIPYSMSVTAESFAASQTESTVSEAKGERFADMIMFGFIEPVVPNDTIDPDDLENYNNQKKLLTDTSTDYSSASEQINYSIIADLITKKTNDNEYYAFDYSGIIAFIAGIVVLIMLIATIFKAAVRIFKLIALELIAPIPIILYLDPANTKKGETSLEKWFSTVMITYFDLFIRILVISFVAMIISSVSDYIGSSDGIMLKLFIIFGALMFMSIAPEFILGLFGIKGEKGSFNPLTQMKSLVNATPTPLAAVGMGIPLAAVGAVTHGVAGLALGTTNGNIGKSLLTGVRHGAKTGMGTGIKFASTQNSMDNPVNTWIASGKQAATSLTNSADGTGLKRAISSAIGSKESSRSEGISSGTATPPPTPNNQNTYGNGSHWDFDEHDNPFNESSYGTEDMMGNHPYNQSEIIAGMGYGNQDASYEHIDKGMPNSTPYDQNEIIEEMGYGNQQKSDEEKKS